MKTQSEICTQEGKSKGRQHWEMSSDYHRQELTAPSTVTLHLVAGTASVGKVGATLQKVPAVLSLHKIQDVPLLLYVE